MDSREAYESAVERVEAKYGFYVHLLVYIAVNLLLAIINFVAYAGFIWFVYPLAGWGIGVFFHGFSVFVAAGGRSLITERMIEKEMNRKGFRKA